MSDQAARMMNGARRQAVRVQENSRGMLHQMKQHFPNSKQALGLVTILTGIVVAVVVGGVTIGGTLVTLFLATPVFLLFSPVLVPLGFVVALMTGGFLSLSAVFLAFCSTMSWLDSYLKGRHPVGADRLDSAKHRIVDTASHIAEKARETVATVA